MDEEMNVSPWTNDKNHSTQQLNIDGGDASDNDISELPDEQLSISSESGCHGIQINKQYYIQPPPEYCQTDIRADFDFKQILHADELLPIVQQNDLERLLTLPVAKQNSALLLSIVIGNTTIVYDLLNAHFDPTAKTTDGKSALHLACLAGNATVAKLLLDHGADVNQWDTQRKMTPLHTAAAAGSVECIQQLLRRGAHVNAGIERRSALHMAVESNAINCVETLLKYGANPNTPQVYTETPLHTAAGLGLRDCMELLLKHGSDVRSQFGRRRLTALHLAAEDDYVDCVQLLLNSGAKIDARTNDNQTALHLACLSQCVETVDILVRWGADVNAVYKDGRTALHAAIVKESKSFECARILLKAGVEVNRADNYGYTPLHIAALNEFSTCACMLIEYGADMTARTKGGISALSFIVRRTPEVLPKFVSKFDASIKVNEHEIGDVDCEIKLDFRLLAPNKERGETELLLAFIEVGQKKILKHPLCETFLFLKWRRIRKFFVFSLIYHAIFVFLFTAYILAVYDTNCESKRCQTTGFIITIDYFVLILNFFLLGKEFFQMGHGFSGYIKYWENWIQWAIIIGVFLCALNPAAMAMTGDLKTVPTWKYHVAAIVIFLVWLELMMLVGRFPIFGLYVQMFTKVAVNFSKFLLAYCCLIVAFALSFGVLFNNYPAFKYMPWALLKTIAMMAGELEFEDIFYAPDIPIKYPVTAHAMFFTFVLLVTVILTNLLVGLAVSDIQGLQASAGLDRLTRQAELVQRLESLFFSKLLRKAPAGLIRLCQRSALLRTSRYQLQFCIRPNDPRDTRLPKDVAANVYQLVAERKERNQKMRQKRDDENRTILSRQFDRRFVVSQTGPPEKYRRYYSDHQRDMNYFIEPNVQRIEKTDGNGEKIVETIRTIEQTINRRLDEINKEIRLIKMKILQ